MTDDRERLERLEEVLDRLRQEAAGQIVVVEGTRDVAALEALGVGGRHVVVHRGRSLQEWMDSLAQEAAGRAILLLTDWDRTGGRLMARLAEGLQAVARVDTENRRRLARACRCRCIEHIPSEVAGLRSRVGR